MTLLTPEQIEAVKETTKVISQDPAWRKAIVTVMKTPNLPTITKAASSVNMSVSSFIRHFNVACWKPDEIIRPLLKDAKIFTTNEIDDLVIQGRVLYRSGIPDVMRAGAAGAGGAGAAGAAATAGKGAIILKGLAILGGLIAFAVVSYYVAGAFGEWSADDPIEPTWLGDPEERKAWEAAEQATHVVTYGDVIAINDDGIDVTDVFFDEPVYLYVDWEKHPHLGIFVDYIPTWGEGAKDYGVSDGRIRTVFNDVSSDGCPYYTYGEVCVDLISKKGRHMYLLEFDREFDEPCGRKTIYCKTNS